MVDPHLPGFPADRGDESQARGVLSGSRPSDPLLISERAAAAIDRLAWHRSLRFTSAQQGRIRFSSGDATAGRPSLVFSSHREAAPGWQKAPAREETSELPKARTIALPGTSSSVFFPGSASRSRRSSAPPQNQAQARQHGSGIEMRAFAEPPSRASARISLVLLPARRRAHAEEGETVDRTTASRIPIHESHAMHHAISLGAPGTWRARSAVPSPHWRGRNKHRRDDGACGENGEPGQASCSYDVLRPSGHRFWTIGRGAQGRGWPPGTPGRAGKAGRPATGHSLLFPPEDPRKSGRRGEDRRRCRSGARPGVRAGYYLVSHYA